MVLRHGASTLTLDAVAAEAKVSKGGLLYHFPSKRALIEGMIDRMIRSFEADLEKALQLSPPAPGRFARVLVSTMLERPPQTRDRESRMSAALLAAAANQPDLLAPVHQAYTRWMSAITSDGLPSNRAITVFAALDGIWFWTLFGVYHPNSEELQAIVKTLEAVINGTATAAQDFTPSTP